MARAEGEIGESFDFSEHASISICLRNCSLLAMIFLLVDGESLVVLLARAEWT